MIIHFVLVQDKKDDKDDKKKKEDSKVKKAVDAKAERTKHQAEYAVKSEVRHETNMATAPVKHAAAPVTRAINNPIGSAMRLLKK